MDGGVNQNTVVVLELAYKDCGFRGCDGGSRARVRGQLVAYGGSGVRVRVQLDRGFGE